MTTQVFSARTNLAYLSGDRRLTNTFPEWGEGGKDDAGTNKVRDKASCFPELMCSLFTTLCTNERFSVGNCTSVRL
jgi:hypothetical protein